MKNTIRNLGGAALLCVLPFTAHSTWAQTAVEATATTTSAGTISEFSPDTITVRSESATAPVAYRYSKSTTYVDEAGSPVSIETVRSGLPVTVYYTKDGDDMVASRVIVHRAVSTTAPVAAPAVEETKRTTTTTTTAHDDD